MSFKKGGYLRLWEHHPTEYKYHVGRASLSRYYDGEYRQDFSGFVRFVGKAKEVEINSKYIGIYRQLW